MPKAKQPKQIVRDLLRVIDMLMPGIGAIAVPDYKLVNEAPIRAYRWLNENQEEE
jgi:hypothetical protein